MVDDAREDLADVERPAEVDRDAAKRLDAVEPERRVAAQPFRVDRDAERAGNRGHERRSFRGDRRAFVGHEQDAPRTVVRVADRRRHAGSQEAR